MIVDTSAIMAILLDEIDQEVMADALLAAPIRTVSAGTWIELAAVVTRHPGPNLATALYNLDRLFLFGSRRSPSRKPNSAILPIASMGAVPVTARGSISAIALLTH